METNTTATATTYVLQTATGRHIRRASRVIFSDGYQVDFMESMPKGLAIVQAIQFRERDTATALASLKAKAQGAFYR